MTHQAESAHASLEEHCAREHRPGELPPPRTRSLSRSGPRRSRSAGHDPRQRGAERCAVLRGRGEGEAQRRPAEGSPRQAPGPSAQRWAQRGIEAAEAAGGRGLWRAGDPDTTGAAATPWGCGQPIEYLNLRR